MTTTTSTAHTRTEEMVVAQRARRSAAIAAARAAGPDAVAAVEDQMDQVEAEERAAMRRAIDAEVDADIGSIRRAR